MHVPPQRRYRQLPTGYPLKGFLHVLGMAQRREAAVVEVAREASTETTGELVTQSHVDTALAQLESRLAWRLVTAGIAIAAVVVTALRLF